MTTGSYTKDISYTHSRAAMPPKNASKPVDAKELLDSVAAHTREFNAWTAIAGSSVAAVEALNQAVEVLGADALGDDGQALHSSSKSARSSLSTGLDNILPNFSLATKKLSNWANSMIKAPLESSPTKERS